MGRAHKADASTALPTKESVMIEVNRGILPEKKIKTSNEFEFCYLRHQYLRRVKYNPTLEEMQVYMPIATNLVRHTFSTYINLFKSVGMYQDDVLNIGRVHVVSFLGLYSLESNKNKMEEFSDNHLIAKKRPPNEKDFEQKNKANFSCFFKQRMEDLVRVCRQKVRNIRGLPSKDYMVFCSKEGPPKYPHRLLKDYKELGYKKIDYTIFKSIRKKANVNHDATIFEFGGIWYVALALEQKNLDLEDIVGSGYDPYENFHNMQPDDLYKEKQIKEFACLFDMESTHKKKITLRNFIAKNNKNRQYKEEISTAKKLLRHLGEEIERR